MYNVYIKVCIIFWSVEGVKQKQTSCYDIDVEVDDRLKMQMNNALQFNASHQEIQVIFTLDKLCILIYYTWIITIIFT